MNLRLRPSLLCVAYRYGLLSSPAAGTEQGACCSRRLLVGVEDFRDIAVMAADRLQWEKKVGDALAIGFVLISGKMVFRQRA
jgi:hypothetical protein